MKSKSTLIVIATSILGSIFTCIMLLLLNRLMLYLFNTEVELFPNVFNITVTDLKICDGTSIDSYPDQIISQNDFRNNAVYVCGYLQNNTPMKPARPIFYVVPEEGRAFWYKSEVFLFEADYFYMPIKNEMPDVGTYTILLNRARDTLYEAEFTVVP